MLKRLQGATLVGMTLDLVGAAVLALYALIIGPLGVLRGPIVLERAVWYYWVLAPQGLLARSVRAAIDWRLGNFDAAIGQAETLIGLNEDYYKAKPGSRSRRRVLEDLYTLLARAYLHAGHIDDAMMVIIRAKKCLGIERLGGLAGIDAKTAHLVRAGLAAGRLLDGGGLATMFVKTGQQPAAPAGPGALSAGDAARRTPPRQGASSGPAEPPAPADEASEAGVSPGAKIIPFPPPDAEGNGTKSP